MKRVLFLFVIMVQFVAVFYLFRLIEKKRNTLGISINVRSNGSKTTTSNSAKSNLKYFYEMSADSIDHEVMPWSGGQVVDLKLNSEGLNDEEYSYSDLDYRIVAIGDSFTYGQFVERKDNWVSLLEKELNNLKNVGHIKIINLGTEGYDIEYAVEKFRLRGVKYNPRLLIWLLKDDDFMSVSEILTPLVKKEEEKVKNLLSPEQLIVPESGKMAPQYILDAVEQMNQKLDSEKLLAYQKKQLESIRNYYKGPILVPYFYPSNEKFVTLLNNWAKKDGNITLVKLTDIYDGNVAHFPDGHPNILGHKIIYNDIIKKVEGLIRK